MAAKPASAGSSRRQRKRSCNAASRAFLERAAELTGSAIGLVGVHQDSDLDPRVQASQVVAIIDHHASGSGTLALEQPRRIDLRPWGATATILEQQAQRLGVVLPKPLACAALGAIVSQTQGLQSASTTVPRPPKRSALGPPCRDPAGSTAHHI